MLKALNKNPLNRYQTAAEMRSDLVRALSGQAVQATPLMSDDERTELMRAAPGPGRPAARRRCSRRPAGGRSSTRTGSRTRPTGPKRVWGFVGIGVLCVALLAGAVWLTLRVITAPPPAALVAVPDLSGMSLEQATATTAGQPADPGHRDQHASPPTRTRTRSSTSGRPATPRCNRTPR